MRSWSSCGGGARLGRSRRGPTLADVSRPDPGAPSGPQAAGCHAGGARCPAPAAAGPSDQCGHDVPGPQTPGAPAKKTSRHAAERDTPRVQQARIAYRQRTTALALRRLTCVDEAGVNLALTRLDGRAPKEERGVGTVPQNDGENITRWGAFSREGIQAVMTVNGATALARRRARRLYVPPYWPDLSPLDRCLSNIKTALRTAKARPREALDMAVQKAMETVTVMDARHWFRHCGYVLS